MRTAQLVEGQTETGRQVKACQLRRGTPTVLRSGQANAGQRYGIIGLAFVIRQR